MFLVVNDSFSHKNVAESRFQLTDTVWDSFRQMFEYFQTYFQMYFDVYRLWLSTFIKWIYDDDAS